MRPRLPLVILLVLGSASTLYGGEPVIRNVNLRSVQVGGTTSLVIDGDELANARLLFPFPVKQALKPGSTDKKATIDVTLGPDVEPGYGHLRVVTDSGVSAPVVVGIDSLPSLPFAPEVKQLPMSLHGVVAGSATMETKFPGKAKQKVIVEVEAQRLGSKLRPIVHLLGPDRLQLAWSWGAPSLYGDARLEATLPADGLYTVTLHDAEYAAAAPSFFRLKIGAWSFADMVFPPVLARGKGHKVELVGMSAPAFLDVPALPANDFLPLLFPKGSVWSGPRPFVRLSPHAELVEQPLDKAVVQELPPGPVGVSGRLLKPYEEDRYRVPVVAGKKVRLEVFADRYGAPVDVALVVRNDKGDALARAEDSQGTLDPLLDYTAPDKVTSIIVGVVDSLGRGGPRAIYRLVVTPQDAAADKDDFQLFTTAQNIVVPVGGRYVFPVHVERRGFQGKIDVSPSVASPGLRLDGGDIPPEGEGTLVTLARTEAPFEPVIISWRGQGAGTQQTLFIKGHPLEKLQPWLASEIALAPSKAKAAEFDIDWNKLPSDAALVPGSKLTLPIKVARAETKAPVKLSLVTSQPPVLVNAKPDPTKQLRVEKPVDLNPGASEAQLTILVPPQLQAPVYDLTVQAELLGTDKKTVQAVAFAPVKRLPVRQLIVVQLAGSPRIDVPFDAKKGAKVTLKGTIQRHESLTSEVALAVAGLPAGAKAAPVNLKAGVNDFTLSIALPPNVPPGEIKGLKLSGSAAPDPKQPNVRVRSRDVDVTLVLVQAK